MIKFVMTKSLWENFCVVFVCELLDEWLEWRQSIQCKIESFFVDFISANDASKVANSIKFITADKSFIIKSVNGCGIY